MILIINDINLEIGFQPILLFPCIGAYAAGYFIQAGVSIFTEFASFHKVVT